MVEKSWRQSVGSLGAFLQAPPWLPPPCISVDLEPYYLGAQATLSALEAHQHWRSRIYEARRPRRRWKERFRVENYAASSKVLLIERLVPGSRRWKDFRADQIPMHKCTRSRVPESHHLSRK